MLVTRTHMGERVVTYEQARRIYDLIARAQDTRPLSERRALDELSRRCAFEDATAVFEFGCGTGRYAAGLMATRLPSSCTYTACDVSPRMVDLARHRLSRWASRVQIRLTDGSPRLDQADGSFDRFISTYVLDLLSASDTELLLSEAHRVLRPGGLLGLVSMTEGPSRSARVLTSAWERLWRVRPWLVGGCRPVEIAGRLEPARWSVVHRQTVGTYLLASRVVVAERV
jgi:ubiquinone/menaquinone biosynthesis C-methylase UbiE